MIIFNSYNADQLFDILYSRAKMGLKHTSYSHEVLKEVASLAHTHGDARYALELLWRAAKVAESEGKQEIMFEDVRKAQISHFPIKQSIITELPHHQKMVLFSIARLLIQSPNQSGVFSSEIKSEYEKLCLEKGESPRKQTQFWVYLQELKQNGIIQLKVINRQKKGKSGGRSARISITDLPVKELVALLEKVNELTEFHPPIN
jgi:cell division control protein 6